MSSIDASIKVLSKRILAITVAEYDGQIVSELGLSLVQRVYYLHVRLREVVTSCNTIRVGVGARVFRTDLCSSAPSCALSVR